MLIVSSNLHQSVVVKELDGLKAMLKVTVLGMHGTKVRLGFEVVPGDPARPSEGVERLPDGPPGSMANRGMESTQVWDWSEEDDVEAKQHTDH